MKYLDYELEIPINNIVKIFIFPSEPTFHAMNLGEKIFIWIKSEFFLMKV